MICLPSPFHVGFSSEFFLYRSYTLCVRKLIDRVYRQKIAKSSVTEMYFGDETSLSLRCLILKKAQHYSNHVALLPDIATSTASALAAECLATDSCQLKCRDRLADQPTDCFFVVIGRPSHPTILCSTAKSK